MALLMGGHEFAVHHELRDTGSDATARLEERLGGAAVRVVVGHPSREIAFWVEADGEHPSHRPPSSASR